MSTELVKEFLKFTQDCREWQHEVEIQNGDSRILGDTRLNRGRTDTTGPASMRQPPVLQDMRPTSRWLGTGLSLAALAAIPATKPMQVHGKETLLSVMTSANQYLNPTAAAAAAAPTDWVKLAGYLGGSGEGFSREAVTSLGSRITVRADLQVQVESVYRRVAQEWLAAKQVELAGGADALDGVGARLWFDPPCTLR